MKQSEYLVTSGVILFTALFAAGHSPPPPPNTGIADPSFLELVSLRESRDGTHRIPVTGPQGKTWYRERTPGADLRHLKRDEPYVRPSADDDQYTIMIWVNRSHEGRLRDWSQERVGKPIGIVVDGGLHTVTTLHSELTNYFTVWYFQELDDALKVWAGVLVGGDKNAIDTEFERLQKRWAQTEAELDVLREQKAREGQSRDAMEIISLRKARDDRHSQPIQGPEGTWWYRDPVAGLDLSDCETSSLGDTNNSPNGLRTTVKDSRVTDFARWCEEREGEYFGFSSNGYLLFVDRMPGNLVDSMNRLTLILEPVQPALPGTTAKAVPESGHDKPRIEVTVQRDYVKLTTWDSAYFQIVSLRAQVDPIHTQRIEQANGKHWYRANKAAFDLGELEFASAGITGSLGGKYRLFARIREDAHEEFSSWCEKHAGEAVGIILDGRLVRMEWLGGQVPGQIEIATYTDWNAAVQARDALRSGGIE